MANRRLRNTEQEEKDRQAKAKKFVDIYAAYTQGDISYSTLMEYMVNIAIEENAISCKVHLRTEGTGENSLDVEYRFNKRHNLSTVNFRNRG